MNFKGNFFVLAFLIISNSFTVVYSIESASVLRYYKKNNNQEQNTVQKKK